MGMDMDMDMPGSVPTKSKGRGRLLLLLRDARRMVTETESMAGPHVTITENMTVTHAANLTITDKAEAGTMRTAPGLGRPG